jgi:hypothetical protein
MRVVHSLAAALALAGLVSAAQAQSLTRDQVRADLPEAIRTGDIAASGDSGLTLREQHPQRYEMASAPGAAQAIASRGSIFR